MTVRVLLRECPGSARRDGAIGFVTNIAPMDASRSDFLGSSQHPDLALTPQIVHTLLDHRNSVGIRTLCLDVDECFTNEAETAQRFWQVGLL